MKWPHRQLARAVLLQRCQNLPYYMVKKSEALPYDKSYATGPLNCVFCQNVVAEVFVSYSSSYGERWTVGRHVTEEQSRGRPERGTAEWCLHSLS